MSGGYLAHRLTGDLDLFCHHPDDLFVLRRSLKSLAAEAHLEIEVVRDAGTFIRCMVGDTADIKVEMDLVLESIPDIEPPPPPVEGVVLESLADLRAAKLTCILSRSEPRDLVDLLFLDRAGYPPENDLHLALQKDAGIDPGVLAWLLQDFPCKPLPRMLEPLTEAELDTYRHALAERFRQRAVPMD